MAGKKQIVSINFMSNFVFVGWKWNPGWGWCTVGGRAYWNSARFVSQTCLTTQSHKHTCTQTGCRIWGYSELGSPACQASFPSQLFPPGLWLCSYSSLSSSALLSSAFPISLWAPPVFALNGLLNFCAFLHSLTSHLYFFESFSGLHQPNNKHLWSACRNDRLSLVPLHPDGDT